MNNLIKFVSEQFPEPGTLKVIDASKLFTLSDNHNFYLYRGVIRQLSEITSRRYGRENSADQTEAKYFYEAILGDKSGDVKLDSPWIIDEKKVYDELLSAFESKRPVEVTIFINHGIHFDRVGRFDPNMGRFVKYPVRIIPISDLDALDFERDEAIPDLLNNRIRKVGKSWEITFGGTTESYSGGDGFYYLRELLLNPNRKLPSIELHTALKAELIMRPSVPIEKKNQKEEIEPTAYVDPNLNSRQIAIDQYRIQLNRNITIRATAEAVHDEDKIEQLDRETDLIEIELKKLLSRNYEHNFGTDMAQAKSAQETVSQAILRAVKKIKQRQPDLVMHLGQHLTKSYMCEYEIDPDFDSIWDS